MKAPIVSEMLNLQTSVLGESLLCSQDQKHLPTSRSQPAHKKELNN